MQVLRIGTLAKKLGVHRSTVYRVIDRPGFPPPVFVLGTTKGWLEHEVEEWLQQQRKPAA
jgi:predicted DNA-binding transcriptional regulator AlpA